MFGNLGAAARALAESRRIARMNAQEFEAARLERFRRLVRHAGQHSAYYAAIIKERGINIETCTPDAFPLLTKSILMENFDRIVTDNRITKKAVSDFLTRSKDPAEKFLGEFRVMHTSGTSGEVGYFLYSDADWIRGTLGAVFRRRRRSFQRRKRARGGRFRFAFYGATGGHFAGVTMATAMSRGPASLIAKVETFEINTPIAETIAALNEFQPDILSGYTAALRVLGDRQTEGLLKISPMAIAATGETVTQADMAALKAAFGAEVTSAYGCTEHLGLGGSDPGGETMTLNDAQLIFEFHEDHSVITNLFNYTMPLIRYRMSDILIPVPQPADAPRRLVIKNLVGRTERVPTFETSSGARDFISPHTINEIFVAGVSRFQFHITGPASFRFLAILDANLDAAGRAAAIAGLNARLKEILAQKAMPNVTFEVVAVDHLDLDPRTRKFRLIVDDREPAAA
jgi:phenylacetate-coenzyme A ligase PaaK-like adenylate-forming protein